jgi:DNA transformation protein and related proteins
MSTASARDLALDIAGRIEGLGPVAVKRFFGGAALAADGVQFGFVMKGSLYLRVDEMSRADFEALGAAPFAYAGSSRTVTVASCYEAPDEVLEDAERLRDWAARAHRAALATRSDGHPRRRGAVPARRRKL